MPQQLNNNYEILTLPVDYTKNFLSFTLEEIKDYYQWFLGIKNKRLDLICQYLFTQKSDCLNESALNVIELFLLNSVSVVPKSLEQMGAEFEKVPNHLKPYAKPDDFVLDNRTVSICYDVGIYMGELIIKLDNKIKWRLECDDQYVDYGHPVLSKKGCSLELNPFGVAKNMASKIYKKTYEEGKLMSVFQAWKKGFKVD